MKKFMKANIIILAALLGSCMTGCGKSDASSSNTSASSGNETSNSITETESAQTETSAADTLTTENTDESVNAADTSESEVTYSFADLIGEWSVPDSFGSNYTTMTIRSDGTFYVRYAAGGKRLGEVRVEQIDGISCYSFYEYDSAEPWMQYACGKQPVMQLNTEQEGGIDFIRVAIDDVAISKMNDMTYIMALLSGAGNPQADEQDTLTIGDDRYELLEDSKLNAIDSDNRIAFEKLLEQTTSGELKTEWQTAFEECLLEQDGKVYIRTSRPHGYHIFETNGGVTITNQTETSFTATTNDSNQMEGCGSADFVFDGTDWKMESFMFQ